MEFGVDKNYEVVEVVAFNDDAKRLINAMDVNHRPIDSVIIEIIKESKKRGYIKAEEKTDILISASFKGVNKETGVGDNSSSSEIDKLLNEIEKEIEGLDSNIVGKTIKLTSEARKTARKHDISMGKYELYLKLNELGKAITLDEINSMNISDLLKIIDEKGYDRLFQKGKEAKNAPVTTLIPEEVDNSGQTPKNIATPSPISTPIETPRNNDVIKTPSNPSPALSTDKGHQSKEDGLTNSSLSPSKGSSHQSTSEGNYMLKLKHYNGEQSLESKAIRWDFVIENTGNMDIHLRNVKVRYYFKDDFDKINFAVYFYSLGEEKTDVKGKVYNITQSNSANRYLEVTFEKGSISPGDSAWVFGAITREDWTDFNQEDDWSFLQGASTFTDWDKMTVYVFDKLVWGSEPN